MGERITISDVLAQLAAGVIVGYALARLVAVLLDYLDRQAASRPAPLDPVDVQIWDVLAAADAITREAAGATD